MTYENLKSYQQAKLVYDLTIDFCKLFIDKKSRTYDQMVQAARSGKQNIAEGSAQSKQKPKSELYLLSIASASLKELLEDYQDFLRQRNFSQWRKDDVQVLAIRQLAYKSDGFDKSYKTDKTDKSDKSYKTYKPYETDNFDKSYKSDESYETYQTDNFDKSYKTYKSYLKNPESAANMLICLINQTTYLLDQQIRAVEKQMKAKGISLETHSQKFNRISQASKKINEDFDKKLQEIVQGKRKSLDD